MHHHIIDQSLELAEELHNFSLTFLGENPTRNRFHQPSKDGCGSLGIGISTEYLPAAEMASCCDDHDICYDTCNKDKELCDLDFKRCLYSYCDKYEKSTVGGDIMVKGNVAEQFVSEHFPVVNRLTLP